MSRDRSAPDRVRHAAMPEYPDMATWQGDEPVTGPEVDLPLVTALTRAAAEADFLASALLRHEHDIGRTLSLIEVEGLRSLQDVDVTRQGVEGLGRFLAELARQLDAAIMCAAGAAAMTLTMQAQARRLAGDLPVAAPGHAPPDDSPELWG